MTAHSPALEIGAIHERSGARRQLGPARSVGRRSRAGPATISRRDALERLRQTGASIVRIYILGAGTPTPTAERFGSSYVVHLAGERTAGDNTAGEYLM